MAKKYTMTIAENKMIYMDYKLFDISFDESFLSVVSDTFDFRSFHRKAHLAQLIRNFKAEGLMCYMVFLTVIIERSGAAEEKIEKALSLASSHTTISQIPAVKKWLGSHKGQAVHFLTLDDSHIRNVSDILDNVENIDTQCYFIFDRESNKGALFAKIENFHKQHTLDDKRIISLSLEFIKIGFGNREKGDVFMVFTCRLSKEEIRDMLLDSMFADGDKFEVVIK